ncbi:protein kinase domain-containing protein [Mycobacterium colombiense]
MEGTPFGRYRLIEMLGRGGMGEVWRAYDTETKRTVAIKVLPPHLADDNEFVQRFRREAEAAAQLNSPHVIPIHHYGEIDGRLYVDMRLIDGHDLGTLLTHGPLAPARGVRIIDQVAKALYAAHKVGLIHRDIKPSNILVDDDDFAYLIDFGIARAADETRMTKSGHMIGTFQYIAPERLDNQIEEDARADIYSLACVLYEALTGQPPFAGSTAQLMFAHVNTPPPRPSVTQPDVPPLIDEVIATGMAKDPNQRYATTIELADAARVAITEPAVRPTPSPSALPETERASLPSPQRAGDRVTGQPRTLKAESPAPKKPTPVPPQADSGDTKSRKARLIAVAIGLVLIGVSIILGIKAFRNPESAPTKGTASATPTSIPTLTPQATPPSPTAATTGPSPLPSSTTITTTVPPTSAAPTGAAVGSPCSARDAAKLGYDPNTGKEIVCVNQQLASSGPAIWTWSEPPPMTTGVHATGASCDVRVDNVSRSADGYLIICEPIHRGDPYGGYWQHLLGPIE